MNHNVGMQHVGLLAFNAGASYPHDIRKFNYFGFVAEVVAAITTDAVFQIKYHEPDAVDPCAPGPAQNVKEVPLCDASITSATDAQVTIPAGTPIGQVCAFTIPCRPGQFISIDDVSGTVNSVRIVMVLSGPQV